MAIINNMVAIFCYSIVQRVLTATVSGCFSYYDIIVSNETDGCDSKQPDAEQTYPHEQADMTGTVRPLYAIQRYIFTYDIRTSRSLFRRTGNTFSPLFPTEDIVLQQ